LWITSIVFLDIYTGLPGSVHDAHVLAHSMLYKRANAGQVLSDASKTISRVFVIGDSGYPMLPWLTKPYNQTSLDSAEKHKNWLRQHCCSKAFGHLKAR